MRMIVDEHTFLREFQDFGRMDNFSPEGLRALYEYLEEIEPDYELDVIGLCCTYSEQSFDDIVRDYKLEGDNGEDARTLATDYLEAQTVVVAVLDESIVYCSEF